MVRFVRRGSNGIMNVGFNFVNTSVLHAFNGCGGRVVFVYRSHLLVFHNILQASSSLIAWIQTINSRVLMKRSDKNSVLILCVALDYVVCFVSPNREDLVNEWNKSVKLIGKELSYGNSYTSDLFESKVEMGFITISQYQFH